MPRFEPEAEPTDEDMFWYLLPEILERMEHPDPDPLTELVRLSEEMGLYEEHGSLAWLRAVQPPGTLWFSDP